ncbi:hypothetical protein [Streptomyces sp. AD55]|uniref:hypothetical protein n=1 Tax=Streptomyces sp. AD55 TaxID=3242895 RepID=UPI00352765F6
MGDAEVVALHARRRNTEADTLTLLRTETDENPLRDVGAQSHLFLVAQPTAGRQDMCLPITGARDWNRRLRTLIRRALEARVPRQRFPGDSGPDLSPPTRRTRRARGVALSSSGLGAGRVYTPEGRSSDESAVELQLFEDGGLRLLMTRLSEGTSRPYESPGEAEPVIFDVAAVVFTRHMLELIRLISEDGGYHGNWAVAAEPTGSAADADGASRPASPATTGTAPKPPWGCGFVWLCFVCVVFCGLWFVRWCRGRCCGGFRVC